MPVLYVFQKANQRYQDARAAQAMELNDSAVADAKDAAVFARQAGSMLGRLHPPARLRHAHALLGSVEQLYITSDTLFTRAFRQRQYVAVPSNADTYTRATHNMNEATSEISGVKSELNWRGDATECQQYTPESQDANVAISSHRPSPASTATPAPAPAPAPAVAAPAPQASTVQVAYAAPAPTHVPYTRPAAPVYSAPSVDPRIVAWTKATNSGISILAKGHTTVSQGIDNFNAHDAISGAAYLRTARDDFNTAASTFTSNPPPAARYRAGWSKLHDSAVKQSAAIAYLLRGVETSKRATQCQAADRYSAAVREQIQAQKQLIASLGGVAGVSATALPTSWRALWCVSGGSPATRPNPGAQRAPTQAAPPAPISTPVPAGAGSNAPYVAAQRQGVAQVSTAVGYLSSAIRDISAGNLSSGAQELHLAHTALAGESTRLLKQTAAPTPELKLVVTRESLAVQAYRDACGYAAQALSAEELAQAQASAYVPGDKAHAYIQTALSRMGSGGAHLNEARSILASMHA